MGKNVRKKIGGSFAKYSLCKKQWLTGYENHRNGSLFGLEIFRRERVIREGV